jgi:hypothetical protein
MSDYSKVPHLIDYVPQLEAEIAKLRAALEPLSTQAKNFAGFDKSAAVSVPVTVGELRHAAALANEAGE